MVCKMNPMAAQLLVAVGIDPRSIPRPRDVWTNAEMTEVTVFTRTGGGNRDAYREQNDAMANLPGYLRDVDWTLDATYAEFVFAMPAAEAEKLRTDFAEAFDNDENRIALIMEIITMTADSKFERAMKALRA
jgi:hypothetical protein